MSQTDKDDLLVWQHTNNGIYTVKSGYWLGKTPLHGPAHNCWEIIWKAGTLPKVKNFLWRACWDFLPTKVTLARRHISTEDSCPLCNSEKEDIIHALFLCPQVRNLWSKLNPTIRFPSLPLPFADILSWWFKNLDFTLFNTSVTFAWLIWYRRNDFIFQQRTLADDYWIKKCLDTVGELLLIAGEDKEEKEGKKEKNFAA